MVTIEEVSEGTENIEGILLHPPRKREYTIEMATEAFRRMAKLRLLEIRNTCFPKSPNYLPNELRWIDWDKYPLNSLPTTFEADILVGLRLHHSRLKQLWEGRTPWLEYAQIFRNVISRQDYRTTFTVFGVKSVVDILQNILEHQYLETLNSFLFEATARIENPTKGCTALFASLEQKVEELQARVTALEARLEGGSSCTSRTLELRATTSLRVEGYPHQSAHPS
ncbi:hypothetical protein LguiA_007190 [Lonicera macranthoides]